MDSSSTITYFCKGIGLPKQATSHFFPERTHTHWKVAATKGFSTSLVQISSKHMPRQPALLVK